MGRKRGWLLEGEGAVLRATEPRLVSWPALLGKVVRSSRSGPRPRMKDVNPAPSKPAERWQRLICREAKTLPAGRRSEIGAFGKPKAHFTVISTHSKEHRHGLIDGKAEEPCVSLAPGSQRCNRKGHRSRQLLPQGNKQFAVERALGGCRVEVHLDADNGGEVLKLR